jgi:ribosomal protein S18 acetylase RimI-like enzyme
MKNNGIVMLFCAIFFTGCLQAVDPVVTIERYQDERDYVVVKKILDDNSNYLRYEALGCPQGTTEKYLRSSKYITDVVRADGVTIGFVNYVAFNITFLTFNFGRFGLVHLMGVDKEYQHRGYGKALLQHAKAELKKLYAPVINLMVDSSNSSAIALYEREDFVCKFNRRALQEAGKRLPSHLIFTCSVDVPKDKLPRGNLIQRHPKVTAAVFVTAAIGLWAYSKYRK